MKKSVEGSLCFLVAALTVGLGALHVAEGGGGVWLRVPSGAWLRAADAVAACCLVGAACEAATGAVDNAIVPVFAWAAAAAML